MFVRKKNNNFFFFSSEWLFESRNTNEYEDMVHEEMPGGFNWDGQNN